MQGLIVAGLALAPLLLGACGQRGPLYLPPTGVQTGPGPGPVRPITATPLLATPPLTSDPAPMAPTAPIDDNPPAQAAPAPSSGQIPPSANVPIHP